MLATDIRPTDFDEVIGQSAIKETLMEQIANGGVREAYLFSGPSGVGKTTIARIVASKFDAEVKELDAASNSSVEDIREILKDAKYKPIAHEKKIFIIDEAHMLSKAAFNAFLKMLEEPPKYCIFILCTTEPNKIIPTVRNRCQHLGFRRVGKGDIIGKLMDLLPDLEYDICHYIAELADGGVRDAITLLETVVDSGAEGSIDKVQHILGIVSDKTIHTILEGIHNHDENQMLEALDEVHNQGFEMKSFIRDILAYMVRYERLSIEQGVPTPIDEFDTLKMFEEFTGLFNTIKYEENPFILVESVFLCMARRG